MKKIMLILFLLLTLLFFLIPCIHSQELSDSERVLKFLEEVIMIDVTRYNVTFIHSQSSLDSDYFKFESSSSKFDVMYDFQNKELFYLNLEMYNGVPLYTIPLPNSILETGDLFLQRYQSFTGLDFQQKRDVLSTISELEDRTITLENLIFNFQYGHSSQLHTDDSTTFEWVNVINGVPFTTMYVSFQDGHFIHIFDNQLSHIIASEEVNVSKEEAISITKEIAENYREVITIGNETILVQNLKILDEPVDAKLLARIKEPYMLYPWWYVTVYADNYHPALDLKVRTQIWADTGEIIASVLVVSPSGIPEFPSWTPLLIMLIAVGIVTVIYRRKIATKNQGRINQ